MIVFFMMGPRPLIRIKLCLKDWLAASGLQFNREKRAHGAAEKAIFDLI
jgi:hypothetical protein